MPNITLPNFDFFQQEDGSWLSKAKPFIKAKKPVKEEPQFKVIHRIEEEYKKSFDICLVNAVKDIAKYLI